MVGFGTSPLELLASDAMLRNEIYCENFYYIFESTSLAASSTQNLQVQIDSASDFVYQDINLVALTGVNAYDNDPDFLLTFNISGSGRNIQQRAIHSSLLCGTYRDAALTTGSPGRVSFPRLLPGNSTFQLTIQNRSAVSFSGAGALVQISLGGFKIFYTGGNRKEIFHVL